MEDGNSLTELSLAERILSKTGLSTSISSNENIDALSGPSCALLKNGRFATIIRATPEHFFIADGTAVPLALKKEGL